MSPARTNRNALGVIGAGRWGITLAHAAAKGGRAVMLYTPDEGLASRLHNNRVAPEVLPDLKGLREGVRVSSDLGAVSAQSEILLLACGVREVRSLARALGQEVDAAHKIVHAVRGREPDTLKSPSAIVRQETCVRQVGALQGPIMVDALLADAPGAAVVASPFPAVVHAIQARLASDNLRIYGSSDLLGVEAAAAASSVLAIGLGVCLELELGPATMSTLIVRGLNEISRVVVAAGGEAETAFGLSGLGDLLVRRDSESRELRFGRMLARGESKEAAVAQLGELDAIEAARTFCQLAGVAAIDARIVTTIDALAQGVVKAPMAVKQLMELGQMDQ